MAHAAKMTKAVAGMSKDEFDAWMESLPPAPGIRHVDDGDDAEDDAEALADLAAGRCHSHEVVSEWLRIWGTSGSKPFEEWLADRHG